MIAEIHVAPSVVGDKQSIYGAVDAAIRVIQDSGLCYEVGALGTTVQGPEKKVWQVFEEANKAVLLAGAQSCICSIRAFSTAGNEPDMYQLVDKFRN